jgi:hypothetical protein
MMRSDAPFYYYVEYAIDEGRCDAQHYALIVSAFATLARTYYQSLY